MKVLFSPKLVHAWGVSAVAAAPYIWKELLQIARAIYAMTMIHKRGPLPPRQLTH